MADPVQFDVSIPSDTSRGFEVQERILGLLEKHEFTDKDLFGIKLALEEAIVNAIKHGNGLDLSKSVHISCQLQADIVRITIEDEGPGFNPEEVPDPTDDDNLDKPSGRGLMLMRAFMTNIEYNDKGNRVLLEKKRST
ncbi:ATP-binding protein [Planctomicrobium sp. SH664]|uniref:ATP-binding protein n=1 Tax=Planctomicrobium sp. SH664 TaxID=3448125 RepID=UPI003F5B60B9